MIKFFRVYRNCAFFKEHYIQIIGGYLFSTTNIFNYNNLWSVGTKISVLEKSEIVFELIEFVSIVDSNYSMITQSLFLWHVYIILFLINNDRFFGSLLKCAILLTCPDCKDLLQEPILFSACRSQLKK